MTTNTTRLSLATDTCGAVLCAGLGTRLRPATERVAKPAVPFLGRPLAMHSVDALARLGVERIGCNLHYRPEPMRSALQPALSAGLDLRLSMEEGEILGTGGGIREIWKQLGTDRRLILCHGDVVLGTELGPVLAAHQASGATATLVLKVRDGTTTLRGVFTDATDRVARILAHERPGAVPPLVEHAFTGIQILEPDVFEFIPEHGASNLVTDVFPRILAADLLVGGYLTTAFYADLGTYERYLDAQRAVFDEPARLAGLAWPAQRDPGIWLGETVTVEPGAVLEGPLRLEGPIVVRSGAHVGPYVSASGELEFTATARVENAALWGRGQVDGNVNDTLLHI